jgi:hypothetical protein
MSPKVIAPFLVLLIAGCASQPDSAPRANVQPASEVSATDGRSFETAVVIKAADESAGVKAEYAWIREHIPGAKPAGQSLQGHGGKMFDLIHLKLRDGSMRDVYFDITGFFGKP